MINYYQIKKWDENSYNSVIEAYFKFKEYKIGL